MYLLFNFPKAKVGRNLDSHERPITIPFNWTHRNFASFDFEWSIDKIRSGRLSLPITDLYSQEKGSFPVFPSFLPLSIPLRLYLHHDSTISHSNKPTWSLYLSFRTVFPDCKSSHSRLILTNTHYVTYIFYWQNIYIYIKY